MHLFNILLQLLPFVFKAGKAGANLKGKKKKERGYTRHEAEVPLGKEHLQPKALRVHFRRFFFFHTNVSNSMSSLHQKALWIHGAFVRVSV